MSRQPGAPGTSGPEPPLPGSRSAASPGPPSLPRTVVDAIIGGVCTAICIEVETGDAERLPDLPPYLTYFALLPVLGRDAAFTTSVVSTASPRRRGG
ncbi:hypothetical protein [Spirillospora albida]|uniref:hypothetical protein n=1 Tax=Spirillospora albida TaxID=58123 RepID=UPI0012F82CAD|nr:hypothetical protein [Spirillospora albida]